MTTFTKYSFICLIISSCLLLSCSAILDFEGKQRDTNTDVPDDTIDDSTGDTIEETDEPDGLIDDDYFEIDSIEDITHDDIQLEDIRPEDVEIEPTGPTWTDTSSGLTWQNPPAESSIPWQEAMDYCEDLTLDGHEYWRLPTISELRSLIRGCEATQTEGPCGVKDGCLSLSCWSDLCTGCSYDGGPDDGCYWPVEAEGPCCGYWSSSSFESVGNDAWLVGFDLGDVYFFDKDWSAGNVRCVR